MPKTTDKGVGEERKQQEILIGKNVFLKKMFLKNANVPRGKPRNPAGVRSRTADAAHRLRVLYNIGYAARTAGSNTRAYCTQVYDTWRAWPGNPVWLEMRDSTGSFAHTGMRGYSTRAFYSVRLFLLLLRLPPTATLSAATAIDFSTGRRRRADTDLWRR